MIASNGTNVDDLIGIGSHIVNGLVGKQAFEVSLKRTDRVQTIADDSKVKNLSGEVHRPRMLFQRLLITSRAGEVSLEDALEYELSPVPATLFQPGGLMREADKPLLASALTDSIVEASQDLIADSEHQLGELHYVLDGGSLVHRVPWKKGDKFCQISAAYADFTLQHYGRATVVFDGYANAPSTKDVTHQRRGGLNNSQHATVHVRPGAEFFGKKEHFLTVPSNKRGLIEMISCDLKRRGCTVIVAEDDADVDIVKSAISSSENQRTAVIGEDTDLLILLLHHASFENKDLYLRSDRSCGRRQTYDIIKMKHALGQNVCLHLLFLHAFTGCDSLFTDFWCQQKECLVKTAAKESCSTGCR